MPSTRRWTLAILAGILSACLTGVVLVVASPACSASGDEGVGPVVGAQWHATWAAESESSRSRELCILESKELGYVRIDVGWEMLQPKQGQFDTNWAVPFVERQIDAAKAKGLKVMVTFWRSPRWANGNRSPVTPPNNPQDYAKAFAWVVERWGHKVDAWEIWNEPNADDFFVGADPVKYTQLLKAAYRAAKAVDPETVIILGGTMYVDTDWIRKTYDAGAANYFDVMAVHPYMGKADAPPELPDTGDRWNMMHVDSLISLMKNRGDGDKPIWFTEFGWSVHSNTSNTPVWERGVTENQQADYLRRSVALTKKRWPQVEVMIWYNSRDKATGNAHQDGFGLMKRNFTPRKVMNQVASLQPSSTPESTPDNEGEGGTSVTVPIAADSWVDGASAGSNWGGAWAMSTQGNPDQRSYLRFDLPEAPAGKTLESVRLRVSTTDNSWSGSVDDQKVQVTDGSAWSETGLTYQNRPGVGALAGTLTGVSDSGSRYSVGLDAGIVQPRLGKSVSFVMRGSSSDSMQLVAHESPVSDRHPELVLTYGTN